MADTPVSPTNVTALPTAPNRNTQTNPLTYSQTADAWAGALPTWTTQVNNIAANVNFNAESAFDSAAEAAASQTAAEAAQTLAEAAADAAESASNATQWVSGQAYVAGAVVWSPINYLSYRANTNTSGTTDPSLSASWTALNVPLPVSVANGGTGATTLTGVVKGNGTSAFTAGTVALGSEVSGTLPVANGGTGATSLTASAYLKGNGTSAITAQTGIPAGDITSGTLGVARGGTGATTLTGVLKGNGGSAFTAAIAGTDFVAPATATSFTALQTFSGSTSVASTKLTNAKEVVTVSATAATGTINYDVTTQSVLYYTSNASANWTVNFRGSSGTSLNTLMSTGESMTVAFLVTQGATAYYNSAVQVDGSSVTPKWQGGTAPTAGNASSIDAYVYTVIKTGAATFTVFASQTRFA